MSVKPRDHISQIISINCNSIRLKKKKHALEVYLEDFSPEIVLVQETNCKNFCPRIGQFTSHSYPGADTERGVAILTDPMIHTAPYHISIPNIEVVCIKIVIGQNTTLIGSVYFPTYLTIPQVTKSTEALLSTITRFNNVILGGDFNCNLNPPTQNPKASALSISIDKFPNFHLHIPNSATYRTGSILDTFIIKDGSHKLAKFKTKILPIFSDHHAVAFLPTEKYSWVFEKRRIKEHIDLKNTDWAKFNAFIENKLVLAEALPLSTPPEIDFAILQFESFIKSALNTFSVKKSNKSSRESLPDPLKTLFKDRSVLIRATIK